MNRRRYFLQLLLLLLIAALFLVVSTAEEPIEIVDNSIHKNDKKNQITAFFSKLVERIQKVGKKNKKNNSNNLPPLCTYEQLRRHFFVAPKSSSQQEEENSDCWNLQDEILHVPLDAIVNRNDDNNNRKLLGAGINGVVHEAHIRLGNSDDVLCRAAVKTDPCQTKPQAKVDIEFYASCLQSDTEPMHFHSNSSTTSSLGSDYLATLVFTAAQLQNVDLPALIPTWGVVDTIDDNHSNHINNNKRRLDPSVSIGVILPLLELEAFDSIFQDPQQEGQEQEETTTTVSQSSSSPLQVAKLILPVAEVYEFIANLGLSSQYVHERDIGLTTTTRGEMMMDGPKEARVFINTNLSFRQNATCSPSSSAACNFCKGDNDNSAFLFQSRHIQPDFSGDMVRRKDARRFLKMMLHFGDFNQQHRDPLYRDMDYLLFSGQDYTMSDVVSILRNRIMMMSSQEEEQEQSCAANTTSMDAASSSDSNNNSKRANANANTSSKKASVPATPKGHASPTSNEVSVEEEKKQSTGNLTLEDIDGGTVEPCTYELLRSMFPTTTTTTPHDKQADASCWSLKDEILHIPKHSIINRNRMRMLGKGTRGVVYEGFVQGSTTEATVCSVAIKTDKCKLGERKKKILNKSCIEDGTKLMAGYQSYISSEYMGALLFVAANKAGLDLPGFLPTWGIISDGPVVDADSIQGILMPIIKFESVEDIWEESENAVPRTPLEVAKLMLPVATALSFVSDLGLSFQDVHQKNIGILDGSSDIAFIYDNTYLSILKGETCSLPESIKSACNFCMEDTFILEHRPETFSGRMIKRKDCGTTLAITWRWLNFYGHGEEELATRIDYFLHANNECTFQDVIGLLQKYITSKTGDDNGDNKDDGDSHQSSTARWSSLPPDIQNAWSILGFDEELWDDNEEPIDKSWDELTGKERKAAQYLGFDQISWDSDSDKELDVSIFFSEKLK